MERPFLAAKPSPRRRTRGWYLVVAAMVSRPFRASATTRIPFSGLSRLAHKARLAFSESATTTVINMSNQYQEKEPPVNCPLVQYKGWPGIAGEADS